MESLTFKLPPLVSKIDGERLIDPDNAKVWVHRKEYSIQTMPLEPLVHVQSFPVPVLMVKIVKAACLGADVVMVQHDDAMPSWAWIDAEAAEAAAEAMNRPVRQEGK